MTAPASSICDNQVEGAEHAILRRMLDMPTRPYDLIDLLVGECHGQSSCRGLKHRAKRMGTGLVRFWPFFVDSNTVYPQQNGSLTRTHTPEWDAYSRPELFMPAVP